MFHMLEKQVKMHMCVYTIIYSSLPVSNLLFLGTELKFTQVENKQEADSAAFAI